MKAAWVKIFIEVISAPKFETHDTNIKYRFSETLLKQFVDRFK